MHNFIKIDQWLGSSQQESIKNHAEEVGNKEDAEDNSSSSE